MKEKYIDESYGFWYEFGASMAGVDIVSSDRNGMDVGPVRADIAKTLIEEHNRLQSRLVELAQAFDKANPEAFKAFWYGDPA